LLPSLGQPAERARKLVDWVERRTGLLADGEYLTFAHLAFQEYFAAQAVLHDPALQEALLQPERLLDPWWREPILLYAGMADDATDFIREVYSPERDNLFRRRLFLAGHCVGEAARVKPKLRRKIRDELLRMWREGPYKKWREEALKALAVRPDEQAVKLFLAALEDEDARVRRDAARALGELGVADERVVGSLLATLEDEDEDAEVRERAARALGELGVADERVIGPLLAALKDEYPGVRWDAARALGELGVADERVIGPLLAALESVFCWEWGGRRGPSASWGLPTRGSSAPSSPPWRMSLLWCGRMRRGPSAS
jgi:hypothetical protein